jgi:CubicO group peptidase (beta-lactamase class C family)
LVEVKQQRKAFGGGKAHRQQATPDQARISRNSAPRCSTTTGARLLEHDWFGALISAVSAEPTRRITMKRLMQGFPPAPEAQVTLENWRNPPFSRWAFQHVRELLPSADITNDPVNVRQLLSNPIDMSGLRIDAGRKAPLSLDAFLTETRTDGIVILHGGRIVFERYANGMTAETPHILMSVSKSMLGLLAGVLVARGALELERPVTDVVPEVAGTAYEGATIRQLLDMRAGIAFDEDYLATSGAIVAYREAAGWNLVSPGKPVSDLRSFYRQMRGNVRPHGQTFHMSRPTPICSGGSSSGQRAGAMPI